MVVNSGINLSGEYIVELLDAKTCKVKESRYAKNLITNSGLNALLDGKTFYSIAIGDGGTAPEYSDTGMQSLLYEATTNTNLPYTSHTVNPSYSTSFVQINEGYGTGTVRELGAFLSYGAGSGKALWSRTVLDSPIVKGADDVLIVRYSISRSSSPTGTYDVVDSLGRTWHLNTCVSNSGMYRLLYVSNMFPTTGSSIEFAIGSNNETSPIATHNSLISMTKSTSIISASDVTYVRNYGPTGGFYIDISYRLNSGVLTGVHKEIMPWYYSSSHISSRTTINDGSGNGIVKGESDVIAYTFRCAFSR